MEGGMELEDDLFFADLSKQISLLIMDEDEDSHTSCRPNSIQSYYHGAIHPPPQSNFMYEQVALRRQSKGTGVFIPQSTQPRRKQRKGRSSSYAKYQKQSSQDTTRTVSQNSFKPINNG
ncbi:hypothetical protein P8452_77988 [Trifolium repens]|jgi:hypothetical protein|nr:hypothetical protein QL285_096121 [Trifolium repens]WJX96844.1 hypothetical protein P8452_77988 [Trifolium repens]